MTIQTTSPLATIPETRCHLPLRVALAQVHHRWPADGNEIFKRIVTMSHSLNFGSILSMALPDQNSFEGGRSARLSRFNWTYRATIFYPAFGVRFSPMRNFGDGLRHAK